MLKKENLHNYQLKAIKHIVDNSHCGLFLQMGLGKTVSTLTALNNLIYEELEIDTVLVIGTKRVVETVWKQETQNWEHLTRMKVSRIIGTPKQRLAALKEKSNVFIISRDNIAWLVSHFGSSKLPFDMLVIDESSSFKNHKSQRFKALKLVQPSFQRVVILTGTPAPNTLIDLWAQIYLLDRGERLGKFINTYRKNYFTPGHTNGHIVYNYNLRRNGEELIHEKISDICISMKTEDYLDLPETIENDINIVFPAELQKQYDDFAKEQVTLMYDKAYEEAGTNVAPDEGIYISATNAAALSNKLLQFANGAVYDEDKNYHEVHDLKLKALEEIVEGLNGQPVLVAYIYKHDLERIMKCLEKYNPVKLKGEETIEAWNAGKIQVLVTHPASGGHGLNLQKGGSNIVWFGQTWSLELYQQLNARIDRQGKVGVTTIHRLITHKTIDKRVIAALNSKSSTQNSLMEAIKATIAKYKK